MHLLLLVIVAGCSPREDALVLPNIPRTPASAFSLEDIEGNPLTSTQLMGKWVVVNLWASWSPQSARELPELMQLQRAFGKDQLAVIGLAIDDSLSHAEFAQRLGITFPIASVSMSTARQIFGEIDALPSTFIIDPQWRLANRHTGYIGERALQKELRLLMREEEKTR